MFTILFRTMILYLLVVFAMRIMGKRQIGDMQPSDLVVTLLISEIAAIPIQDPSNPLLMAIVSVFVLIILEIIISVIAMKCNFVNTLTNGKSALVINKGKIDQKVMKKLRITVPDLVELLRIQGIFDINEVEYALLESNGALSVLQKPYYQPATKGDICRQPEEGSYPSLVISDGKLLKRGLANIGKTKEDITKILNSKSINAEEVFVMILDSKGESTIIKKGDRR